MKIIWDHNGTILFQSKTSKNLQADKITPQIYKKQNSFDFRPSGVETNLSTLSVNVLDCDVDSSCRGFNSRINANILCDEHCV